MAKSFIPFPQHEYLIVTALITELLLRLYDWNQTRAFRRHLGSQDNSYIGGNFLQYLPLAHSASPCRLDGSILAYPLGVPRRFCVTSWSGLSVACSSGPLPTSHLYPIRKTVVLTLSLIGWCLNTLHISRLSFKFMSITLHYSHQQFLGVSDLSLCILISSCSPLSHEVAQDVFSTHRVIQRSGNVSADKRAFQKGVD